MPTYDQETYTIDCDLKEETERAWLVVIEDDTYWIPKSIGEWNPTSPDKVSGEMTLPEWFIDKEGIPV